MSPSRIGLLFGVAAAVGCDGRPHAMPAPSPSTSRLAPTAIPNPGTPKPDANRIRYDAATRTLEVGDPPVPGGRWMLGTPAEPRGVPVERVYQFPPSVDLDKVTVFYTAANGRPSSPVGLREVIAARDIR